MNDIFEKDAMVRSRSKPQGIMGSHRSDIVRMRVAGKDGNTREYCKLPITRDPNQGRGRSGYRDWAKRGVSAVSLH